VHAIDVEVGRIMKGIVGVALGVALTGCVSTAPAPVPLPETPAARALAGWLRTYNADNGDSLRAFVQRAYAASELAARPAEAIARGHRLWRQNYGTLGFLRVDTATTYAIDGYVRHGLTGALGKVYVEVDSQAPHGITGVYLLPFAHPPADLVTIARKTDPEIVHELREYAARLEAADVLSGTVVLRRNDSTLFEGAFGLARRQPPVRNTLSSRFELASLSKLFTAVAVAQLVERGRLRFETTVAEALPDYPNKQTAGLITVHQLLTHTSGLPDFYRNGKIRQYQSSIRSLTDFWPTFALDSLWFEPGTKYDYSNSNYIVLGVIIERLAGMPFETYVQRFIFDSVGMPQSCFCEPDAPRRATPQSRYTSGFGPTRRAEPDRWIEVASAARMPGAPAGGGLSTGDDLARFGAAVLQHKLLGPSMTQRVLTPYVSMDGDGFKGYGFEIYEWFGTRFVGHGGNFWGVMSQIDIYPQTGHVVVVLSNNDASGGEAVRNWTRRALAGVQVR
jgi:CubicO group peptidase (beta-lactamase class C family)